MVVAHLATHCTFASVPSKVRAQGSIRQRTTNRGQALLQPNKRQWRVIWVVALISIMFWPSEASPSLAVKALHFGVDPFHRLPVLPPPLPMGLGDDADAVILHDTQENAYYDAYDSSWMNRLRMKLRDWRDPLDPTTERQLLVGLIVLGSLLIWRLEGSRAPEKRGAE